METEKQPMFTALIHNCKIWRIFPVCDDNFIQDVKDAMSDEDIIFTQSDLKCLQKTGWVYLCGGWALQVISCKITDKTMKLHPHSS